jgi:hypothetical protein
MMSQGFFQSFWIAFTGLIGLLGIAIAMDAGMAMAAGDIVASVVALLLCAACGALCVIAEETRHSGGGLRR